MTAIPEPRGEIARVAAAPANAAGRATGDEANGERLFMDCINLE